MFSNRDLKTDYQAKGSVIIQLNGNSATCKSKSVDVDGSIITIKDEGTYILSGTLDDGMIVVDAQDSDKPQLVFDNVTINSKSSAALYILEADKVFITLKDGTTNTLSNGGSYSQIDDNNIDGTVFSKQDLTFNGSGNLTVTSPADHGIVCKDDLAVANSLVEFNVVHAREGVAHLAELGAELRSGEGVRPGIDTCGLHLLQGQEGVAHLIGGIGQHDNHLFAAHSDAAQGDGETVTAGDGEGQTHRAAAGTALHIGGDLLNSGVVALTACHHRLGHCHHVLVAGRNAVVLQCVQYSFSGHGNNIVTCAEDGSANTAHHSTNGSHCCIILSVS